jgi:tryptophanyl-tRNA synthetase
MTQYKDKAAKQEASTESNGLLSYPVLMAADILLYHTDLVPVGEDQKQHVELTRDIAQRFNHIYGETFTIPAVRNPPAGARVMGLDTPNAKMSKSEAAQGHAVYILDDPDVIKKKIMRSVTDSGREIEFSNDPEKAGVNNLLTIYQAFTDKSKEAVLTDFANARGYGDLKKAVAEVVVECLKPIQARYQELTQDKQILDDLFAQGADHVRSTADKTLKTVYENMGFYPPRR